MEEKNIDGHSHIAFETEKYVIGSNFNWNILPTLEKYQKIMKINNIGTALFCPCTSPEIIDKEAKIKENLLLWDFEHNKGFKYYSQIQYSDGKTIKKELKENPYSKINKLIFEYLEPFQNYYYIPAINLMYDTEDYLIELIESGVVAVKVHGISIGLDDFKKININLLKILNKYDIPIQIHTDYYKYNSNNPINILYNSNNPISWIELLSRYDVRGYLAHGCRLSIECAKLIKESSGQFLVGISPDLLLQDEKDRLMCDTDNYLETLLEYFDEDNLSFDIDFGWNKISRNDSELDYNQLERLEKYIKNPIQKSKILRKNSSDFFKLGYKDV